MSTSRTRRAYVLTGTLDDAVAGGRLVRHPASTDAGPRLGTPDAGRWAALPDEVGALAASLDNAMRGSGVVPARICGFPGGGVRAEKPALTCGNDGCPRQDSNLRRTV